jgi:endonuclease-8
MAFSGDLVLHTHMRMNGSWHVYPAAARWQRPARDMRVLVGTNDAVAVGFNVPIAELLTRRDMARHPALQTLGPDVLDASFDREGAIRRMRARPRDAIADVLIDQRVIAGIGNVFKSEILFLARVPPFAVVGSLEDGMLTQVVGVAVETLRANVVEGPAAARHIGRRTTRSLDPSVSLWVYGRSGKPCRRCGTPIEARKTGADARLTYWCPSCQQLKGR